MNDTTATARKESLEERKAIIDAEIERIREIQKLEEGNDLLCQILDERIDDLLLEKDNLPQTLFNDENLCPNCGASVWANVVEIKGTKYCTKCNLPIDDQAESDYRDLKATEQDARQVGLQ